MDSQRRRDPPAPVAVCLRCGWTGRPPHAVLPDERGEPSLIVSLKKCGRCGEQLTQVNERPPLPIEIVTAVQEADLSLEELEKFADAIRTADPATTPRQLAESIPGSSKIITVATRAGDHWIEILAIVITLVIFSLTHQDAQQAHKDAQRAHRDAQQAHRDAQQDAPKTASLTDAEVRRIAEQIETRMEDRRRSQGP